MGHHKQIKQLSSTCRKNIESVPWPVQCIFAKKVHYSLAASYIKLFSCLDHFWLVSLVCENVFRESEQRWRERGLCLCNFVPSSTQRSIWNVLFLFQLKFYILGVHTRLFDRGRDFFTFAFSVFISLRLYTSERQF